MKSKRKTCTKCGKRKMIQARNRVCTDCRENQFFQSNAFRWFWDNAKRSYVEAMPESTSELIALLEVRKTAMKAKGMCRFEGELSSTYNYQIGHRYPASKGGKMVAENMVIMPAIVNLKLGNRHGAELEYLGCIYKSQFKDLVEFKNFCDKYDMDELKGFVSGSSDNDFETQGMDVDELLKLECERLQEQPKGTAYLVDERLRVASQFAQLCGGLRELEEQLQFEDKHIEAMQWLEEQDKMMGFDTAMNMDVDDILETMGAEETMRQLQELEKQNQLHTDEAMNLTDNLRVLELEENAMHFKVMEARKK